MKEHYKDNKDIKVYVDKFAECRGISVQDALKHLIVQEYIVWKLQMK